MNFNSATTEYPKTSLNKAILSRVKLCELGPIDDKNLARIIENALKHIEREDLRKFISMIVEWSRGDARFALNALSQLSCYSENELSHKALVMDILGQQRSYDISSERHYDVISSYIKSLRGSDPDAALTWLAVMLDGGEDPLFIARRLMIFASEDIGLANSQALMVANQAHYTCQHVGMPEARITLSHATLFCALSPKSNSAYKAINNALEYVQSHPTLEVPTHLRNSHPDKKKYRYPHNYKNHYVEQEYVREEVSFYSPTEQGSELGINKAFKKFKNQSE